MPANFALAKECQLRRSDVEGVLFLAARLLETSSNNVAKASSAALHNSATAVPSSPSSSFVGPVVGALLTDARTRLLLLNALVRVLVPTRRQKALLEDNKYVQAANQLMAQQQQQQQEQRSTYGARSTLLADPLESSQRYRVGRIVGVVPKPSSRTVEPGPRGGPSGASDATATEEGHRWLLAVYIGECVEPFPVSAVAESAFTEAEHRVFVQSALSTNREEGSRRASVLPSLQTALLSAEMAATVQLNIVEIRQALELVQMQEGGAAEDAAAAMAEQLGHRVKGVKRQRSSAVASAADGEEAEDAESTAATFRSSPNEQVKDGGVAGLHPFFGDGAASQAARIARLTEDVAARGAQLQQLRLLLQQKEQEVKAALQQQRQEEAQHRGEVDVWRSKVEEQSRAQERAAKEAQDSMEQRDSLLEVANAKLRRLAGMTSKYKQVVDAVGALMKRSSGDSEQVALTPEEMLIAVQQKKMW